jgi:hypothetical protein
MEGSRRPPQLVSYPNPGMAKAKKSPSNQVNAGRGKKGETSLAVAYFNALTNLSAKDSETRRRGPRGHFLGSRKVFLEGYLPAYLACKRGNRGSFWHELQCSWWDRYPWKLNDDQEPPTDDPEEMAKLASVEPDEEDKKALVEGELIDVRQFFAFVSANPDRICISAFKAVVYEPRVVGKYRFSP